MNDTKTITQLVKLIYDLLDIYDDFELVEPSLINELIEDNLHLDYGEGFEDFKSDLLDKLQTMTKPEGYEDDLL